MQRKVSDNRIAVIVIGIFTGLTFIVIVALLAVSLVRKKSPGANYAF
jgi:hypothetical protein